MKEYQGLKFTEIAEILQTSVNTAKSRMYYGLRAMRKVFKKWKINEETLRYEV
ncbi:MAG: sigma factor-like helix-turn-helix DNA-binding protein [bacterium]